MHRTFVTDGIEIRPAVLRAKDIAYIKAEVSVDHEILRRTGIRNLEKKFRCIAQVAADSSVLSIAASLLGKTPQLVRALFFDKTGERNWFVAWHQDRTVTLNQRVEMDGWGSWTRKDIHSMPLGLVPEYVVSDPHPWRSACMDLCTMTLQQFIHHSSRRRWQSGMYVTRRTPPYESSTKPRPAA